MHLKFFSLYEKNSFILDTVQMHKSFIAVLDHDSEFGDATTPSLELIAEVFQFSAYECSSIWGMIGFGPGMGYHIRETLVLDLVVFKPKELGLWDF